jgi:hypothetical protein
VKVFLASLADAKLLEEINDKTRVLDVTHAADAGASVAAADEHVFEQMPSITVAKIAIALTGQRSKRVIA